MVENYNKYGFTGTPDSDRGTFVGSPTRLRRSVQEELIYRYKYDNESIEYLAIEYHLTPSVLSKWFDELDIQPVDFNDEQVLREFELEIEHKKRVNSIRLAGSILNQMATSWESLVDTEQLIIETIRETVKDLKNQSLADPASLAALTRSHSIMVDQRIKMQNLANEQNSSLSTSGIINRRIEEIFKEIDNLSVIGE